MKIFYAFIISIIIHCASVVNAQKFSPDSLPYNQLIFGVTDSTTGETKKYILLENGQVFLFKSLADENFTEEKQELFTLKTNFVKQILGDLNELGLEDAHFNHPGRTSYFIIDTDGHTKHKVIWGNTEHKVPFYFKDFYKRLMNMLKFQTYEMSMR